MRTFIAFEVPENIKKILLDIQEQLKDENMKASFVNHFHLTLKFLGEVNEQKVEKIKEKLREIKFELITTKLKGIGVFPNENYIRVVWVGLEDGKIMELQKNIDTKMFELGFEREKDFQCHITLCRVKFVKDKKMLVEKLKNIKVPEEAFEVKDFKLKKSDLTGEKPVYTDLEIFNRKN